MQDGTQASKREAMTLARRLQVLSALADCDLTTISTLSAEFARAFPVLSWATNWPIVLSASHSYEYSIDLVKALVAASSRGLHVVAALLGSNSSSCNGDDWILQWEMPQLLQLEKMTPMMFVSNCITLCGRVMEIYVTRGHGNAAADMHSRQAELAATARSTGAWQRTSSKPSTVTHRLVLIK
jgi:hypothetical protein